MTEVTNDNKILGNADGKMNAGIPGGKGAGKLVEATRMSGLPRMGALWAAVVMVVIVLAGQASCTRKRPQRGSLLWRLWQWL